MFHSSVPLLLYGFISYSIFKVNGQGSEKFLFLNAVAYHKNFILKSVKDNGFFP